GRLEQVELPEVDELVDRLEQAGVRRGGELRHVEADEVGPLARSHLREDGLAERRERHDGRLDDDVVLARVELLEPCLETGAAARVTEGRRGEGQRGRAGAAPAVPVTVAARTTGECNRADG